MKTNRQVRWRGGVADEPRRWKHRQSKQTGEGELEAETERGGTKKTTERTFLSFERRGRSEWRGRGRGRGRSGLEFAFEIINDFLLLSDDAVEIRDALRVRRLEQFQSEERGRRRTSTWVGMSQLQDQISLHIVQSNQSISQPVSC